MLISAFHTRDVRNVVAQLVVEPVQVKKLVPGSLLVGRRSTSDAFPQYVLLYVVGVKLINDVAVRA